MELTNDEMDDPSFMSKPSEDDFIMISNHGSDKLNDSSPFEESEEVKEMPKSKQLDAFSRMPKRDIL